MKRWAAMVALLSGSLMAGAQMLVLKAAPPVVLRLGETLDTADMAAGQEVRFEVAMDWVVDGLLLAKKGAIAHASVSEVKSGRRFGRGGKLVVGLRDVTLADGDMLPLDSELEDGGARFGFALMHDAASLLSPLGAVVQGVSTVRDHGYEMAIPAGSLLMAYPAADAAVERVKFAASGSAAVPVALKKSAERRLTITGNVPGAMIELDHRGKPMAAPHTFVVTGGLHDVVVMATGYDGWERAVPVAGEDLTLEFRLTAPPPEASHGP